ncbi:MAG: 2-C-methyl-D-erythritol 4-phosphate cytidylyltransferase [Aquificae bacterium]|nr:2-C-methyl-D-erythritol 4-phosphate cytidylyltransferase [Aquificota bacterium]
MKAFVLLASGEGRRTGFRKQFALLCGKPMFMHALEKALGLFDELILVLPPDAVESTPVPPGVKKVAGGKERQDSVYEALKVVNAELVVLHDAARPLTPRELFLRVTQLGPYDGLIAAARARDTIKEVENGRVVRTLDRSRVWHAQTPQAFKTEILLACHERARKEGFLATDDAALLERYGYEVGVLESSFWNFKVTYPEDLKVAELLLCGQPVSSARSNSGQPSSGGSSSGNSSR